jgi:serine/threonine-protein kinase
MTRPDRGDVSDGLSPVTPVGGRYRIERELGRGGMATVYLACDLRNDGLVALKVLHPELSGALGTDRFLREISIAARLQHPNILPLFDSGTTVLGGGEERTFYVMPYVAGESLRARLQRETQLGLEEAIVICRQIAAALDYAHGQGIVHRDIKPENILLEAERSVVADFGIAKALDAAGGEKLTETGLSLGTPAYMSPEQATASRVDGRSDVYSLACVMYEMLVGDPPFLGSSPRAVMARHALDPVPSVRTARPEIPDHIEAALRRGLAKVPGDRFASAGEFAAAVAGSGPARAPSAPSLTRRLRFAAALALGGVGLLALWHWRPIADEPTEPRRVAVLPFDVAGAAPDLGWLADGMVDLFSIQLRGDTAVQVVDPRTVLGAWYRARARGDTTGGANARLARRVGAGRVVEGTVAGSPARLVLSASIRPVGAQQPGPRVTVTGPADSLPVLVDRLTAQLVGIDAGVDRQRLGLLMGNSLAAVRAFARGRAEYRRGHLEEASRYLHEATVLDSTFALAALELARLSGWLGDENLDRARRLAWTGRDRLSPTDRALLESWDRQWAAPAMFGDRRAWVAAYPNEPRVWYDLGDAYFHWGMLAGQDSALEQARRAFERGWSIDSATTLDSSATVRSPLFAEPLTHMVELAQLTGDTAEVLRLTALGLEADTAGQQAHYLQWHQAVARGDGARRAFWANQTRPRDLPGRVFIFTQWTGIAVEDAARAIAEDMARATGELASFLRQLRAGLALSGGRPGEANRDLAANSSRSALRQRVLIALYWQGDTAGIADIARRMVTLRKVPAADLGERREQYHDLCVGFQWRLSQGETEGAAEAVELLRTAHIPGLSDGDSAQLARFAGLCSALLRVLQVGTGFPRPQPLADLDSLARTDVFEVCCGGPTGFDGNPGANLVLARAAEYQGDLPLALSALRRRAGGFMLAPHFMSAFLREEGRLSALTGDTAGAIRAYQHYLALRRDPEPALRPEVERVRAELSALLSEPAGRSR